jgi:hypothetical protein
MVCFGSMDNNLYAVDIKTGEENTIEYWDN